MLGRELSRAYRVAVFTPAGRAIDVVVPSRDGQGLLERCLPTLVHQTVQANIIVVDDASSDGTAAYLEAAFPDVEVVSLDEARGFAHAVNHGIEAGAGAYVVLVNNDVECDPQFIEHITNPLRTEDDVGMVAG